MPSWLAVVWALSFGYVPVQSNYVKEVEAVYENITVAQIALDFRLIDRVTIFTDMESFQVPSKKNIPYFNPYRIDYTIGMSADITSFLKATLVHECDYTVLSGKNEPYVGMGETKLFVTIHGGSK